MLWFSMDSQSSCTTPVVIIGYNRPDLMKRVLVELKRQSVEHLLVVLDGPKPTVEDHIKCGEVKSLIEMIDWPKRKDVCISESNMGLRRRVVTGLNWAFTLVEEAIVLEDDCVPSMSFLKFCSHCLERYKEDTRVWTICGQNLQKGRSIGTASYYMSSYAHCWGWATWKDRWEQNTFTSGDWRRRVRQTPSWKERFRWDERIFWQDIFYNVEMGRIHSWAYQWQACIWMNNGNSITPNVNLVMNVGFAANGTNTVDSRSELSRMPTGCIERIADPAELEVIPKADRYVFEWAYLSGKRPSIWVTKMLVKSIGRLTRRLTSGTHV